MLLCSKQAGRRARIAAFTLAEVLIAVTILALSMGGILYGYVQADRFAEWSSMSLAAQSLASQGMEQARCAQWNSQQYPLPTAPGPGDELYVTNDPGATWSTNLSGTNYSMDVPATGAPFFATNTITITTISKTPPLRMIRSDCVWTFPRSGIVFTNTMVTYRAPDQ
jgi:type II secretory pathway pseudopilin PulG